MFTVSLHPEQNITFMMRNNIYYSSIKHAYQTFHGSKHFRIFHDEEWLRADIVMREVPQHPIYKIDLSNGESILCNEFLKVFIDGKDIDIRKLNKGDKIDANTFVIEKMKTIPDGKLEVIDIVEQDETSDWLFGIRFLDEVDRSYSLTNGVIVI